MISMTGYGYRESLNETATFSVELKSYNNRYLDIFINLPPFLSPLEPVFRELIAKKVSRGRVEFNLKFYLTEKSMGMSFDEDVLDSYVNVLNRLRERVGICEPISLANLQRIDGLIDRRRVVDLEEAREMILPVLEGVLVEFVASRKREGDATKRDVGVKLGLLERMVETISSYSQTIESRIKENLLSRFKEMLGEDMDLQRVYSETAVMLMRYTINEELERLASHISSFLEILEAGGAVGKKLDFLAQEMNREINTIGSKNIINEVAKSVVDGKDSLEQIREQLRNVE